MVYNKQNLKDALSKGKKRLNKIFPLLNDFQISQFLTLEYYNRVKEPLIDYKEAIHLSAKNWNVACGNGSPHVKRTDDISHVTCALCLLKH